MLSRRAVIAGGVATLAGSAIVTRAQTSPAEGPGAGARRRPSSGWSGVASR